MCVGISHRQESLSDGGMYRCHPLRRRDPVAFVELHLWFCPLVRPFGSTLYPPHLSDQRIRLPAKSFRSGTGQVRTNGGCGWRVWG